MAKQRKIVPKIRRTTASAEGWGWGGGGDWVVFGGGVLWFMGRHCVRSIPKKIEDDNDGDTTTTAATIDTDGNQKVFPPKRCGVGAPRHRPALKSMGGGG